MSEQIPESENFNNLNLSFFGGILRDLENFRVEEPPASEDCSGIHDLELDNSESEPSDKTASISDDSFENEFSEHKAWMKEALESTTAAKEISIIEYPDIPIKIGNHAKLLPKFDVGEETGTDPFIESLQAQRKKHEEEMKQKAEQRAKAREKEDEELRNWNVKAGNMVQEIVDNGIEQARRSCRSVKIMKSSPKSN
ncbi:hypothetical protein CAEBREN_19339 [Caenorhabditis brenneri]|uniref:Clathrin light chain n=1 Tax=Caenorhabditis brenneri TaxID=135651 RepID=G0MA75_CAEBE|nr:hypothetical protein CAEBREN_19339 [Caenorhabditis brenneri]